VTIRCTDNDSLKPLIRNATLHVSISDINDETPKFEHSVYQGHVRENESNSPVIHLTPSPAIRVVDADTGRNAHITFSLKEASAVDGSKNSTRMTSDVGYFRIDPRSGRLWTVPALDAEEQVDDSSGEGRKFVFYVVATDDGVPERRSSSALMNIFVDDINDNPPAFEHYHYNFEANFRFIITQTPKLPGELRYNDRDHSEDYAFTSFHPSLESVGNIEENAPVGMAVGQVFVRDADRTEANRKVRFSLRGRPEDLFLVDIDRTTGQMSMRRPVDYEKQSSISLTVVAENDAPLVNPTIPGRPPSNSVYQTEASVIINVLNVNDNRPEFIPIAPHRKHIIFAWEQLPVAGSNQTAGKNQRRFCEPIPYKVIDKDCEPASREFCCTLELENTFDGMFGLLEEIPSVLCALKRPSQPQSYKLLLKARDGNGNDSLTSQKFAGLEDFENDVKQISGNQIHREIANKAQHVIFAGENQ
ncbi:unnamed protein product, partial [Rodentolepis nana]|uniref:Cadherin n=1 Tax=Rodentolepis nana TaxID=102285 RepID=A0A0R3TZ02_RODNA